jgi:hypothetical protein
MKSEEPEAGVLPFVAVPRVQENESRPRGIRGIGRHCNSCYKDQGALRKSLRKLLRQSPSSR